jgi:hypothetical protein
MTRSLNAVLALAALGFASTSFAQCPASAVPPWSAQSTLGGSLAIVAGGFDGTACRLSSTITLNGPGVNAFVRDNTPAGESRYRAQFWINADTLTGINSAQAVKIFGATTETPANGVADVVRLSLTGNLAGSTKILGVFTACDGQPGFICSASVPLAAGANRIEIDWQKGATGSLRVWVNNTTEGTPTSTLNGNSAAWGGVDFAVLGLSAPSVGFRTNQLNRAVGFDEFDSRRQTFIGL